MFFFLVLGSDDSFLVFTNTGFCVCRNSSGRGAVYVCRAVVLMPCTVRRVPRNHALPCLLHCSTFVNVLSLLFEKDSAGILDSKLLQASFSPACKLPGYNAELS
jgi:hypothetical protein